MAKDRKDYANEFEYVRDEGELVFANGGKTCVIFQSGEFWVLEGTKCFHDFMDWLGFDSAPSYPYELVCCVIKNGEYWEQRFLFPSEIKEITNKIRGRYESKNQEIK